jgi:hypothetical protein
LKYSGKVATGCIEDEEKILERKRKLEKLQRESKDTLEHLASSFDKNAKKEYQKWNCDAMYDPKPKQNKVSIVKIFTEAVKEGFEIFNQVKGMLPEGAMSGMKIPGLPEGMAEKVGSGVKMFKQAEGLFKAFSGGDKAEFEDFEEDMQLEDELTEAKFFGGESDSAYAERVRDW